MQTKQHQKVQTPLAENIWIFKLLIHTPFWVNDVGVILSATEHLGSLYQRTLHEQNKQLSNRTAEI